jgi:glycogen(starch) synthase
VVAGAGADGPRLQDTARRLGLAEAVRWTGFVPEAELAALYRRATVYLHTGQRESFGLSVLEAAAAGLPVVAVDEGGPRDILDGGRLGRLAPADPAALAEAVAALLADPAGTAALARAAAAAVMARFRWEAGAEALVAAVRSLPRSAHPVRRMV